MLLSSNVTTWHNCRQVITTYLVRTNCYMITGDAQYRTGSLDENETRGNVNVLCIYVLYVINICVLELCAFGALLATGVTICCGNRRKSR